MPSASAKLRASITPGTVLILLAGRHRGRRVVFLKQLPSGLLLVSGPFKVNGVPIKRVNQAYVITTSTKVDISGVKIPQIDEAIFKGKKQAAKKDMFEGEVQKKEVSQERIKMQTELDGQLMSVIKATPHMKSYLNGVFSLKKGDAPHLMKF